MAKRWLTYRRYEDDMKAMVHFIELNTVKPAILDDPNCISIDSRYVGYGQHLIQVDLDPPPNQSKLKLGEDCTGIKFPLYDYLLLRNFPTIREVFENLVWPTLTSAHQEKKEEKPEGCKHCLKQKGNHIVRYSTGDKSRYADMALVHEHGRWILRVESINPKTFENQKMTFEVNNCPWCGRKLP